MSLPFKRKVSAATVLRSVAGAHGPMSAMIEIVDRCNEVCVHCYQVQGTKGEIPTSDWKKVLDELASMGILFLTVSGGEATLHKDFLEIVAYARALKFAVKVYSNGLRIDEALADQLAALAVQEVQMSLYSPTAPTHDWVTGVAGSYDKVLAATRFLRARGVKVVLKTVLTSFNIHDRDRYVALVQELDADYSFDPNLEAREDGDRTPEAFRLDRAQKLALRRELAARQGPAAATLDEPPCGACRTVHIEPNGQLRPCTLLPVDLGSVTEHGVAALWNGEAARQIRNLRWHDIHGCRDCDLQPYCGRCFAAARHEAGDALGPYGSACERAQLTYEAIHGVQVGDDLERPIGPYRLQDGKLTSRDDALTDLDRQRRAQWGWVSKPAEEAPHTHAPGDLVQIRRPGAKRAQPELIPASALSARISEGKR